MPTFSIWSGFMVIRINEWFVSNVLSILTFVLKRMFSWYSLSTQQSWGTLSDDSWSSSTASFSFFKALFTSIIRPPILPAIYNIVEICNQKRHNIQLQQIILISFMTWLLNQIKLIQSIFSMQSFMFKRIWIFCAFVLTSRTCFFPSVLVSWYRSLLYSFWR